MGGVTCPFPNQPLTGKTHSFPLDWRWDQVSCPGAQELCGLGLTTWMRGDGVVGGQWPVSIKGGVSESRVTSKGATEVAEDRDDGGSIREGGQSSRCRLLPRPGGWRKRGKEELTLHWSPQLSFLLSLEQMGKGVGGQRAVRREGGERSGTPGCDVQPTPLCMSARGRNRDHPHGWWFREDTSAQSALTGPLPRTVAVGERAQKS